MTDPAPDDAPTLRVPGVPPHAVEIRLEDFADTDLGNAERLVARHGRDLRHCPAFKIWFRWKPPVWALDEAEEVVRLVGETARAMQVRAAVLDDAKRRAGLFSCGIKLESATKIQAALKLAKSLPDVFVAPPQLDADAWLLNVVNGTLDLRTGALRQHRREDLCTKLAPVAFDPSAQCPRFLQFLKEVFLGRADLIAFVQRAVGYALTGSTAEQVVFVLHGGGSNGKTTFLEVLRSILGDYAKSTPFATLLARKDAGGPREDIADLVGARLVTASEAASGRRLDEAVVKQLTGGDEVKARKLYCQLFGYTPAFKLFLAVNHLPSIRDDSVGMWRRIRLIPFDATFEGAAVDKGLLEKLRAEAPGILNWALEGCAALVRDGLGEAEAVKAATDAYRANEDHVGGFLSERCDLAPGATVAPKALSDAYKNWCAQTAAEPLSAVEFNRALGDKGLKQKRTGRQRLWHGVALAPELFAGQAKTRPEPSRICTECRAPLPPDRDSCEVCAIAEREAGVGAA